MKNHHAMIKVEHLRFATRLSTPPTTAGGTS
jgi:hypothetical protein